MGFGAKAKTTTNYTDENGGSGKDKFLPSKAGKGGAQVNAAFFLYPDTTERKEDEYLARELSVHATINGNKNESTWRTMLVRRDNPNDAEQWAAINEIDVQEGLSDEDKKELKKPYRAKLSKQVFFLNVFSADTGTTQILKGSWEEMEEDKVSGKWKPKSKYGGKTEYALMWEAIQTGARYPDPKNKLKSLTEINPHNLVIVRSISGEKRSKQYRYSVGLGSIPEEALTLPRYDIEGWLKDGIGIWPNDAVEKVLAGEDYYAVAKEYGVQLYPELEETVTVMSPVPVDDTDEEEDDELFAE